MNLALWLERAGISHGDRPALGSGSRVVRSYAECAGRVARLAASLRQRFGLEAGERVAIVAKNSPDYLELMFGIWHAGLAAVPANAKLHGRELAYILEHSGARVCFASRGLDSEIGPHAPATLERLITIGSAEYEALFAADPISAWPCQGDDLAWLFYTSGQPPHPDHRGRICTQAHPGGLMKTPTVEKSAELAQTYVGGDVEEMWRVRDRQVPMGFGGEAWDVAWAAVYLASDESRYVTGIELVVDGGLTLKCV